MRGQNEQAVADIPPTSSASIYSKIHDVTFDQIKKIDIDGSFGTKIDTLARHILWIRENDPGAKSIVFSQFREFLDVLAKAFTRFKIGFTGIDKREGVQDFKQDPSVGDRYGLFSLKTDRSKARMFLSPCKGSFFRFESDSSYTCNIV